MPCEPSALDEDVEVLREGMDERGVWFAGEHVAPFVALGTVTGAWWSGERVGERIKVAYGLGTLGDREMSKKEEEAYFEGVAEDFNRLGG